eukprot:COSAG02_NODE_6059_length_3835_cov_3.790290_2_plen_114_part_00
MPASTRQQAEEEERAATAVALEEAQGQAEQAAAAERAARDALEAPPTRGEGCCENVFGPVHENASWCSTLVIMMRPLQLLLLQLARYVRAIFNLYRSTRSLWYKDCMAIAFRD